MPASDGPIPAGRPAATPVDAADPAAAWQAWVDGRRGAVAPWTKWPGPVPEDLASWIAWRDVATEHNALKLTLGIDRWRAATVLVLIHLCAALGTWMSVKLLSRPALPGELMGTWACLRRTVLPTAACSALSTIPLAALAVGLPWFWTEVSQTPAAWHPPHFVVRLGSAAFWLVWIGTGLIYLRLQIAITRRVITRAAARLDADPHHCGRCGYARAPAGVKCPECGWTYTTTELYRPRLLPWPRGRFGRGAVEAAFWAFVVLLLNAPYTLALACRFIPDSWERALAPWLNHYQ